MAVVADVWTELTNCPLLGLYFIGNESIIFYLQLLSVVIVLDDVLEGVKRIGISFVLEIVVVLR